jgi:hypothetical protein
MVGTGVLAIVRAQQAAEQTQTPPPAGGKQLVHPAPPGEAQSCASEEAASEHSYSGWQNCDFCHGRSENRANDDNLRQDVLVAALNESNVWRHDDKHALAARVLYPDAGKQNLAYQMQQALGPARYEELIQSDCQSCHVAGEPEPQNAEVRQPGTLKLHHDYGVTCEACHGPAKAWVHTHWEERKSWRYRSPAEKAAEGFVNLRDPVTKARKCLSCHLGSVVERKVVTHEMYAAGHPPLAGFDSATYSLAMPRHWIPLAERSGDEFGRYKEIHQASRVHAANTREVLLGGLASLESNLKLLADYAASPADQTAWPEFALYDCFACHHDLQPQSLQVRSRGGRRPGRPPLRIWPNVLAELALVQSGQAPRLNSVLTEVSAALDARPFAERDRLGSAASAAAKLVCQEIGRLNRELDRSALPNDAAAKVRERQMAAQVLMQICDVATSELCDYDTARQLTWAFERVYEDFQKLHPEADDHAAIRQALGELKNPTLGFDLVRGQQAIGEQSTLAAFLNARSKYNAEHFREQFHRMRETLRNRKLN